MPATESKSKGKDVRRVKVPLTANSRLELVQKQLDINIRNDAEHDYTDFQKDGKLYVCWYYRSMEGTEVIE